MNKNGYSLLEILIGITIFSIFATSITLAFSTYTKISQKNNIIANERVEIISNLEQFLASKQYNQKEVKKIALVKKEGLKEMPSKIECIEKTVQSKKTDESFKAFIKQP